MIPHAGTAPLSQDRRQERADQTSRAGSSIRERCGAHDPGRVPRDLAGMLADGGHTLTDVGVPRDQAPLFGRVALDRPPTGRSSESPKRRSPSRRFALPARKGARARLAARRRLRGELTINLEATLLQGHSAQQGAAGSF